MRDLLAKIGTRLRERLRKQAGPLRPLEEEAVLSGEEGEAEATKRTNFETEMKRIKSPTAVEKMPRVVTVTK